MAMAALYLGAGEFYYGIPARNLSPEEYAVLDEDERRLVGNGRLYELVPGEDE